MRILVIEDSKLDRQSLPRASQKFNLAQVIFNFCNMALAVGATRLGFGQSFLKSVIVSQGVLLCLSAVAFFLVNTAPEATIISLTESKNVLKVWGNIFQLSFPY